MATHSSILAWEIAWTEEPGGLQSMGSKPLFPPESSVGQLPKAGLQAGSLPPKSHSLSVTWASQVAQW